MPANIAKDQFGFLSVYADEKPWHPEVGAIVQGAMTAEQVIKRSRANGGKGLGFVVDTYPAFIKIGSKVVEAPDFRGIARVDTREIFGFASATYKPIQNIDSLRTLEAVSQEGRAKKTGAFISAGALGNGAKLFATLDLSRIADLTIPGDPSKHKAMLSATWSHDATEALRIGFSHRRIECANMRRMQLEAWDKGAELNVRIRHTGNVGEQLTEARRILGFAEEVIKADTALMRTLTEIAVPNPAKAWMDSFLERLIPIEPEAERPMAREQARDLIRELYGKSRTLVGVKPTMYRVVQAVDEYADHYRPLRTADATVAAERRMRSILGEGPAADLKRDAMRIIAQEFEVMPAKVAVR